MTFGFAPHCHLQDSFDEPKASGSGLIVDVFVSAHSSKIKHGCCGSEPRSRNGESPK